VQLKPNGGDHFLLMVGPGQIPVRLLRDDRYPVPSVQLWSHTQDSNITLGDVLAALGTPDDMEYQIPNGDSVSLYYVPRQIRLDFRLPTDHLKLSAQLFEVDLPTFRLPARDSRLFGWCGMVSSIVRRNCKPAPQ